MIFTNRHRQHPIKAAPLGAALSRFARAETAIPILAIAALALLASPHLTRAGDDRVDELTQRVPRLQDAINLYRERTSGPDSYDPITQGWGPLISAGYLPEEPINPITGSSTISRNASACAGWHYDPVTGQLDACIVDPATGRAGLVPLPR